MRQRTGSIDTTRDGRHRVRVTVPGKGRVTEGIYESEEDAEAARQAAVELIDREVPDDTTTVGKYIEEWLDDRDRNKRVRDPASDLSRFEHHVKRTPLARLTLRAVRRRHVRTWLHNVRAKVARQTALNCLNVVRGALQQAVEDELLKVNPAAGLRLPKEKRTEEPWTYATLPEQRALVLVSDEPIRWLIAFAIGTGLRAGEIVTLRLADVHIDGAHPHVTVRYGKRPALPTKTGKIREVPLFGIGLVAAREWLAALPRYAKTNPHGLMFPTVRGRFRDEAHLLKWALWKELLDAAGITRSFRWHDLRHTCASALVSGMWGRAWSLVEVRDMLGHSSVTTTERYAHLAGTALRRAASEARNWPQLATEIVQVSSRLRDLNSRPTVYEKAGTVSGSQAEIGDGGQLAAVSTAYLRAAAAGETEAAAALAAQMGSLYVADPTRAIELATRIVAESMTAARSAAKERTA